MSNIRKSEVLDLENRPCAGATLDKFIQPAILTILAREALNGYRNNRPKGGEL